MDHLRLPLAFGLALIPAGRVGDRFGHRWVFIIGVSLFTLASLACVLAQGSTDLVLARVVQGLGGGMPPAMASGTPTPSRKRLTSLPKLPE